MVRAYLACAALLSIAAPPLKAGASPVDPVASSSLLAQDTAVPEEAELAPPDPPARDLEAAEPAAVARRSEAAGRSRGVVYGVGLRSRWVSVPGWMLDLFTDKNVPLSTAPWGHVGLEVFRRNASDFNFVMGLSYQQMSPPDGNWLGKGYAPELETDYVQFRGLGFFGIDASFVWTPMINEWLGVHFGAGLGLAIMKGKLLRTSSAGCTDTNLGDTTACLPRDPAICGADGCNTEAELQATANTGRIDTPDTPARFTDDNVPPALPIVNLVAGLDFRLPNVKGWEARIEGGFFNAFFVGAGVAYTF